MMTRRCSITLALQMLALCLRTGASRRVTAPAFALPPHYYSASSSSHPSKFSTTMHSSTTDNNAITTNDANNDVAPITRGDGNDAKEEELEEEAASNNNNEQYIPPWSLPQLKAPSSSRYSRFRQHVNPLARRYQMATELPENWPHSDFDNVNLPLYLDIGCGKGGFLLELVGRRHGNNNNMDNNDNNDGNHGSFVGIRDDTYMNNTKTLMEDATSDWLPSTMNYLGLEIRPGVSQYSQARVEKRGLGGILSFVGCNANVDLDRLLTLYQEESAATTADADADNNHRVAFVSIQFPDPHFKKAHSKRRVVTPELVTTLAKFMKEGDVVFLQSDIKDALEAMRERFVEDDGKIYFDEWSPDPSGGNSVNDDDDDEDEGHQQEYGMGNPLGIPTEREVSVLKKGLPVYRTLFKRNGVGF